MGGELHASVHAKDAARLRRAIAAGGDVHERERPLQTTPLHIAARNGVLDCLALLLDSGAAVNAQSHFGNTPLYDACDYRHEAAARLLLARGASGNLRGERGRTPLHVAIKRGLVDVVREMLDAGAADPSVQSHDSGRDTMGFVKRSSASKAERAQLAEMIPQYVSLESAVASGNANAIEAIVKRAFATNDMGTAIAVYLQAVPHHTGLGAYRLRLLMATIQLNRPDLFKRLLVVGYTTGADLTNVLTQTRFEGDQVQTTALHLAAFYGHTAFIEFLVDDCGMDPEIGDALQRRPIQVVTDASDPKGAVRSLLTRLTQKRRFQTFTSRLLGCTSADDGHLLEQDDPNRTALLIPQLERLTQTLSSVRDVRVVFNLGVATLSQTAPEALKKLLTRAFTQLIDDKMVVDDREALLFKMVLRECERRGILSELEVEHWDLQLVKVNMESAPWVKELKQSLSQLQWRINDVGIQATVLRQRFDELDRAVRTARASGLVTRVLARLRSVLSLFSIVLALAGVDGASSVIDTVVDLSDPLTVLAASYKVTVAEQLTAFVDDPLAAKQLAVRDELAPAFERAGIDPTSFAEMLREIVLLEREQRQTRDVETSTKQVDAGPVLEKPRRQTHTNVNEPDSDLEQFPFHYAVQHSDGDLQTFLSVVAFVDETPEASTKYQSAVVAVPRRRNTTKMKITPAVLASHLGYVEITKYFLDLPDYPTAKDHEKKFVTMQRAHTVSTSKKRSAEPANAA